MLSNHQSNPADENPRTFEPFIVPSYGGVDTICNNNQGIIVGFFKKKENIRAFLQLIVAVLLSTF